MFVKAVIVAISVLMVVAILVVVVPPFGGNDG